MSPSTEQPRLILIAEDDADNREGYAEYLTYVGHRVAEAVDGHQALESARRLRPDVILLDLLLPRIDGWEVARQIKADPETRRIFVVALSACVFPDDHLRATAAGCDLFLDKPCYPQVVAAAIQQLLEGENSGPPVSPS